MAFDSDILHWPTIADFTAYLHGVPRPAWLGGLTNHNTFVPDETTWHGTISMRTMRNFYISRGWSSGPHLFLAATAPNPVNTGIFQMTPIRNVGTHAGVCNRDHLGIESVGDFDKAPPSAAQYTLLLAVNRLIMQHWMIPPERINVHNECMPGRTCPGTFLPGTLLRDDLAQPWPRRSVISAESRFLHAPRATAAQCVAYLTQHPNGEYTPFDVAHIVRMYYADAAGLDPLLAIAHMAHDTDCLASASSARPRRNPASLGADQRLRFETWSLAARSHIGRLLAYAIPREQGTPEQQALIRGALSVWRMPPALRGIAPTIGGLTGRWSQSPTYAIRIVAIANAIASG